MEETTNQRQAYRHSAIYDLIYYERINQPRAKQPRPVRRSAELKRKRVA